MKVSMNKGEALKTIVKWKHCLEIDDEDCLGTDGCDKCPHNYSQPELMEAIDIAIQSLKDDVVAQMF